MADEPMLCFDGDDAGRRAAYRAVDLALPLLAPGKSLKFVSLPEGHDPDDLVRAGGREAVEDDHRRGAPARAGAVDTRDRGGGSIRPSAAPAFEARLAALINAIGDDSVRKYYRSEFGERLRALFATGARGGVPARMRSQNRYERPRYVGAGFKPAAALAVARAGLARPGSSR